MTWKLQVELIDNFKYTWDETKTYSDEIGKDKDDNNK